MQTHQPDIFKDKNERQDFFIALLIIALAGIFITQTSLVPPENEPSNNMVLASAGSTEDFADSPEGTLYARVKTIVVDEQSVHTSKNNEAKIGNTELDSTETHKFKRPPLSNVEHSELKVPSAINDNVIIQKSDIIESLEEDPLSTSVAKEELTQITKQDVEEINKESTDPLTRNDLANEVTKKKRDIAESVVKKVLRSAIEEDKSENDDCVIAVGLFQESKNVIQLRERLKSQGFNVFTKKMSTMTQVGIYISCEPTIAKSVLSEIQQIYARDAFIVE